jgi:hypothetical protein
MLREKIVQLKTDLNHLFKNGTLSSQTTASITNNIKYSQNEASTSMNFESIIDNLKQVIHEQFSKRNSISTQPEYVELKIRVISIL